MAVLYLFLQIVVGLLLFHTDHCLVCYNNVPAEGESMLLECSYEGAVCAVTNKTTTTTTTFEFLDQNLTSSESELFYHCAHKSCKEGPFDYCNDEDEEPSIHCSTRCCDTDKCNMPAEMEVTAKKISANDALGCYQLIGERQEKVKCLFEGAKCLSSKIGSTFGEYLTDSGNEKATQYCATKKMCRTMKNLCDLYPNTLLASFDDKCSMDCCDHDYCNTMSVTYAHDDDEGNPGSSDWSTSSAKWIGIAVGVVLLVVSACLVVSRAQDRSKQRSAVYRTL